MSSARQAVLTLCLCIVVKLEQWPDRIQLQYTHKRIGMGDSSDAGLLYSSTCDIIGPANISDSGEAIVPSEPGRKCCTHIEVLIHDWGPSSKRRHTYVWQCVSRQ